MRDVRRSLCAASAAAALVAATLAVPAIAGAEVAGGSTEYLVLVEQGADKDQAVAAVRAAGGEVIKENANLGTLTVRAAASGFVSRVSASAAVEGAARSRPIGKLPRLKPNLVEQENLGAARAAAKKPAKRAVGMDPLDAQLWGLRMVRSDLARTVQPGTKKVKVGVLDSGIDARNPDIAPNFDWKLSRNFVADLPEVDGPCEFRGCVDPVGWDDSGHGTHVAGTIGAAANGFGVSGVAPKVTLVQIRGGQDSGYVFLGPVSDALTYAGDVGLDVVNMSFYVDPWLYNCINNPADSPEAQAEQRTTIRIMRRALEYAHDKGVTLVGSLGNNHEDLGKPRIDTSSPDFGDVPPYNRPIDNATCLDLPVEGPHVIGVSALGPSGRKADYSNYGIEQTEVSAPGGWFRDYFGTPNYRTNENLILSTYPVNALQAAGLVDPAGAITPDGVAAGVQKQCPAGVTEYTRCGYYNWLQGTSMASPHAAGVAALIVSEYGQKGRGGSFGMAPDQVRKILLGTAQERACPNPPLVSYANEGRSVEFDALCEGTRDFNGFYGHGIVDAWAAVTRY
ncbi:peptidase S8 and S53 subtilisin kexin sedolisin [Kribbella flavida DSM 17836]|uniref:Peptidase S8 and S53 subtilisin kexin sedolisin n=1 Tax=Kribbella flavida (strain DSM 17836 / JCM 10339 / NBRC 14399) TaxID=479435 RepID=D2Q4Z2_KRIFD|nr:S8 family serine peptidase [Kribbella flavida]ADB34247.1 peptidase S8 and S53 subtilisin kexin sedolisin [Kribbella flavida DSM 17836]